MDLNNGCIGTNPQSVVIYNEKRLGYRKLNNTVPIEIKNFDDFSHSYYQIFHVLVLEKVLD